MRRRMPLLASACMAVAGTAAVPSIASAAPHPVKNRALTIHATPRRVIAGEPVLIFGRLEGRHTADQPVVLWHRINPQSRFTVIGRTDTDGEGRYEFTRAEGIVNSNRNWFVRGPAFTHSRTIHERVAAEVTMTASADQGTTRHPITFTGQVTLDRTGGPVALQVQRGDANTWRTVAVAKVGANSSYSIQHSWRTAGPRTVRVAFPGDRRNTPAASDPSPIVIDQTQAPFFTIGSSEAITPNGSPATIAGVLDAPGTSTPQVGTQVGLYARAPHSGAPFTLAQTTTTGADGTYSFTVQDTANQLYQARTISVAPAQHSAVVFQGVQDAVSMGANATSSTVGGTITFSGTVAPDKSGHVVYLEKLGRDGQWHVAETSTVSAGSAFSLPWTFGTPGDKQFRARVLGGPANVGGASAPVSVSVSLPPLATLGTS
jgi:hypothetical protein